MRSWTLRRGAYAGAPPAFGARLETAFSTAAGSLAIALVLSSAANAQTTPVPGELARTALEACLHARPGPGDVPTGPFERQGGSAEVENYVHPAGPTLQVARSDGLFACEMVWRDAPETAFDVMAQVIGPAIQARFDAVVPEGIETGLVWEARSDEGFAVEVELTQDEAGTLSFVAATSADETEPPPRAASDR